jgi:phenylalanyl-tRNA synthetase beta subunit
MLKSVPIDFFDAKADLESLLKLTATAATFIEDEHTPSLAKRTNCQDRA